MKLTTESSLSEVHECLTNMGKQKTLALLEAEVYLVVFPWVDTGSAAFETSRIEDESGELSPREIRETARARAAAQASLSPTDAFLLPFGEGDRLSVGRLRTSDLRIESSSISKTHAWFTREGRGWSVQDAGSTNGTTHNDEPLSVGRQSSLEFGDTLEFGGVEAVYCDRAGVLELAERRW